MTLFVNRVNADIQVGYPLFKMSETFVSNFGVFLDFLTFLHIISYGWDTSQTWNSFIPYTHSLKVIL
jgi:hypothetical protein